MAGSRAFQISRRCRTVVHLGRALMWDLITTTLLHLVGHVAASSRRIFSGGTLPMFSVQGDSEIQAPISNCRHLFICLILFYRYYSFKFPLVLDFLVSFCFNYFTLLIILYYIKRIRPRLVEGAMQIYLD